VQDSVTPGTTTRGCAVTGDHLSQHDDTDASGEEVCLRMSHSVDVVMIVWRCDLSFALRFYDEFTVQKIFLFAEREWCHSVIITNCCNCINVILLMHSE